MSATPENTPDGNGNSAEAGSTAGSEPATQAALTPSDVRLVSGHLETQELAAIAVVVSTMSVTSRMEAEERELAEGTGHTSAWSDPVHCHPRAHGLRGQASPTAWQYADR